MAKAALIKETIYLGLAYSFRGLVHYHRVVNHGCTQTGMLLKKQLRVLHLDLQTAGRKSLWAWNVISEASEPIPNDLQSSSNKATPLSILSNSVPPW